MVSSYKKLYSFVHDDEQAAIVLSRLAEAGDTSAHDFIEEVGYLEAYRILLAFAFEQGAYPADYARGLARWAHRLDIDAFTRDRDSIDSNTMAFTYPHGVQWVDSLDVLGSARPLGLWYNGDLDIARHDCVSLVGSRDCTDYGRTLAREFAFELASQGLSVVSGGAFGIDSAAHEGALAVGKTVVVFAGGLDSFYPSGNRSLFEAIADSGGLFVSESPPDTRPHKHRFLSRNRIIAALGLVTAVIEAPYRSGAISTAHHGFEIGRDVCAVPGLVTSAHSSGCHRLLREGALCVTSATDIIDVLPESTKIRLSSPENLFTAGNPAIVPQDKKLQGKTKNSHAGLVNPLSRRILEGLSFYTPRSVDQVASEVGLTPRETMRGIALLESLGIVRHVRGDWLLNIEH